MESVTLGVLIALAAGMAYSTAVLLKWGAEARFRTRAVAVAFLLAMMAEMLAGALLYYLHPSSATLTDGLWLAGASMSVSVFPLFSAYAQEARREAELGSAYTPAPVGSLRLWTGVFLGLVLANEILMGLVFSLAAGVAPASLGLGSGSLGSVVVEAVNSPWFLFTMSAEMFATTWLLRARLPRAALVVLWSQSAIMLLSPPAIGLASWVEVTVLLSSAAMIALFVFVFEHLYRHPQLPSGFSRYLNELLAAYAVMMAGLFLWLYYGDGTVFAASVLLEMGIFVAAILRPAALSDDLAVPWQLRPGWTFLALLSVFVAELFMGAVLDVQLEPDVYLGAIPALPLSGGAGTVVLNAISNGFWFFATITGSTWFLGMMGAEMGALVWFKLRESRNLENRIRFALLLACYGAFIVFYPSFYFSLAYPNAPDPSQVPLLGWSMGLGSYPVAAVVFGAILITYLLTGVLATLFGRRAICSVFCSAPLMYQGTTIDAMKSFNRSSRVGRKYLSSRLSGLYSVTTGVTMGTLVVVSIASYLDALGTWNVTVLGADPSVFFFAFSFSVLWYVMFVAIPYVGNYNCVTMGWCYTGTIAQAFQKIGFFKLKVHSRDVCKDCTTLDCAKGCPIGLVDMPGHFRKSGEFRSSKCCGVGDCVEACPYGNLYVYDVRHWIRERMGLPASARRPPGLPMIRARSTAPPAGGAGGSAAAGPLGPGPARAVAGAVPRRT
jgi:polyferredoxin